MRRRKTPNPKIQHPDKLQTSRSKRFRTGQLKKRKITDVAAGLVFRDGKLLITLRYDDAHLGGLWEFPGGKVERDETFEVCLLRELREELGIEVEIQELIETDTHAYPGKTVRLKFFRCRWVANEPRKLGCADFRWVTASELKQYEFPAADAVLIERLQKEAGRWK